MGTTPEYRTRGRPRDPKLDADILAAGADVVGELGYAAFSVEAVGQRLRIAKTTIYARWPTRAALLDALLARVLMNLRPPAEGDVRDALLTMVRDDLVLATTAEGRAIAQLVLSARDPGTAPADRTSSALETRTGQYREVMARYVDGQDVDRGLVDTAAELLMGAVWGRTIVSADVAAFDPERVVDCVLSMLSDVSR